jgi:hypothetical protein
MPAFVGSLLLIVLLALAGSAPGGPDVDSVYEVDPFWPKPLPNDWLMGQVGGLAVDAQDHIWVLQRPGSLTKDELGAAQDPPLSSCCHPAPPVLEFDGDGNLIQAWGGPGAGYDWPQTEHGIFIDHENNVWVAGSGSNDHQVLKFRRDGTFVLQIGRAGQTGGSNHEELLGRPADIAVDPETNEVYVADGYGNRRIVVFDGSTGAYRRHWGAYGNQPDDTDLGPYSPDAPAAPQFRRPVHVRRRSPERPHPGLSQGWHIRERGRHRRADALQRVGLGRRLLAGDGAADPLRRRRDQPARVDAASGRPPRSREVRP